MTTKDKWYTIIIVNKFNNEVNTLKKEKLISSLLAIVGVVMISVALGLDSDSQLSENEKIVTNYSEINIKNMAASLNVEKKDTSSDLKEESKETIK